MELIGKDTILTALGELTGWNYRDNVVTKTFELNSFGQAVDLFNRICDAADEQNHHPDLSLHNVSKLTVTLSSHDAGGVTREDLKLATTIEDLAHNQQSRSHAR